MTRTHGSNGKAPANGSIVENLYTKIKAGWEPTLKDVMREDYFSHFSEIKKLHNAASAIKHTRKWLMREGLYLGLVDGRYQILDEKTFFSDTERRKKGLYGWIKSVQTQLYGGIEKFQDNPLLVDKLEMLAINITEKINEHRKNYLLTKHHANPNDPDQRIEARSRSAENEN